MHTEVASRYIARGWWLVPIPVGAKGPVIRNWPKLRIADPCEFFGCNIGIILGAASNLWCVDLDHPAARELAEQYLPPTGLVSGRPGNPRSHWFYRVVGEIKNAKHKLPSSKETVVEILGEGNQVVVGPSVHPSGDVYDVLDGDPAEVDGRELMDAVYGLWFAVVSQLGETPTVQANGQARRGPTTDCSPGTDYDERGDVRSLLVRHGWVPLHMSGDNEHWRRPGKAWGTSATLKDFKQFYVFTSSTCLDSQRCYGPFGLYAALEHGGDYAAAAAALRAEGYGGQNGHVVDLSAIVQSTDDDEDDEDEEDDESQPVGQFPEQCLKPLGLMMEIIEHCLRTSRYPQPELSLAAAICLMGTITGRRVTDEYGTRTNVYVLGLDETGTGKEHARQVNKELLVRAGADRMHGSERVGSHAGIVNAVHETPAILMQLDEIGRLLATMRDPRKAPHLYNCITVLMQLYSSSGTLWKADAYADSKKVKTIDQPHLCVYGTATPDSFWRNLSTENIAEGLVGRLMVLEGRGYSIDMQKPALNPMPQRLIDATRWWCEFRPGGGNLNEDHPTPHVIRHSDEADQRFAEHVRGINARRRTESKLRAALWSRSGEKAAKLALIHACSRSRTLPERVELVDVEWGIKAANWMTRRILGACVDHVAENEQEAKSKRILSIIGSGKITVNQLSRRTQWLRARERDEILRDMIGNGVLMCEQITTNGRPKTLISRKTSVKKRQ